MRALGRPKLPRWIGLGQRLALAPRRAEGDPAPFTRLERRRPRAGATGSSLLLRRGALGERVTVSGTRRRHASPKRRDDIRGHRGIGRAGADFIEYGASGSGYLGGCHPSGVKKKPPACPSVTEQHLGRVGADQVVDKWSAMIGQPGSRIGGFRIPDGHGVG